MAVLVTRQPALTSFTRNPVVYEFLVHDGSGTPYGPKGASAQFEFGTGGLAANDKFTVNWTAADGTNGSVQFTAKYAPSAEGEVPADASGYTTFGDYLAALRAAVAGHHLLAPFFDVEAEEYQAGGRLIFTAFYTDPAWTVSVDISLCTAATSQSSTPAAADNTPDNYRFLFEVFFESSYQSGTFRRVASLHGVPDVDGRVVFNIEDILRAQFAESESAPPIPEWGLAEPVLADNFRRYYVRYAESYGTPPAVQAWQNLAINRVLDGGISQQRFADSDLFSSLNAQQAFLTWMPDRKVVGMGHPEYLGWYNHTGATVQALLELTYYLPDGSSTTVYRFDLPSKVDVPAGEVLILPVGYSALGLDNFAGSDSGTRKYTLRVVDAASDWEGGSPTYLSQPRTYHVDRNTYLHERHIVYLNGFGLPEVLRVLGHYQVELSLTRMESLRVLDVDYQSARGEYAQYDVDWAPRFVYRTGFHRRAEVDAMQELLIYARAYEVYDDKYIPLRVLEDEFRVIDTENLLHTLEFTIEPRLKVKNYQNANIQFGLVTGDCGPNTWQTPDGIDCWKDVYGLPWQTP